MVLFQLGTQPSRELVYRQEAAGHLSFIETLDSATTASHYSNTSIITTLAALQLHNRHDTHTH